MAHAPGVPRLPVRQMLLLTAFGIALGLGGAFALTGVLKTLLFEVTPTDAPTFALAAVVLIAAVLAAALVPARRASSIDPVVALRGDAG